MLVKRRQMQRSIVIVGASMIVAGLCAAQYGWAAAGAAACGLIAPRLLPRRLRAALSAPAEPAEDEAADEPTPPRAAAGESDMNTLIEEMLTQGRYALLLRPQIIAHLTTDQLARARGALEEVTSITPKGDVFLATPRTALDEPDDEDEDPDLPRGRTVQVEAFHLDRFSVTNRQYQQFVSAGGYENMSLWEPEAWPALLDLMDRSGQPGPRYWRDGRYPRGLGDHPVTGICWYEAAAYARWVGKRLPTDAEWVKAAAWPVMLPGKSCVQRLYPWGDSMDRSRANLWGTGNGATAPVREYSAGVSVGGAWQMVGNVWEWTTGDYGGSGHDQPHSDRASGVLKSVRGGAFDTYFDIQATTQFQSGDLPLARKHNIGFRCALALSDLVGLAQPAADAHEEAFVEPSLAEVGV